LIKKLKIRGFQSHKDTELEFHPGFNVITGPSDSGKSSIIRAAQLLIENRPLGWDYKSWGKDTKETSVSMEFDEGVIERKRSGSFNGYLVGGEMAEYKAIGRGEIPPQVMKITKMDGTNLQKQHDVYFMLQKTPGEVASMLNEVAGLEMIDRVTGNIEKIVNDTRKERDFYKEAAAEKITEIEALNWLDEAQLKIDQYGKNVLELEQMSSVKYNLQKSIAEYQTCEQQHEIVSTFIDNIEAPYQKILKLVHEQNALVNEQSKLITAVTQYKHYEKLLAEKNQILTMLPMYNLFCTKASDITILREMKKILEDAIGQYKTLQDLYNQATARIVAFENEYKELLLSESICPICGGGIDEETLSWFVEGL
jgi:exonuclease SbcC